MISVQTNFPWTDSDTPAQAAYQLAMKTYAPGLAGSASTAAEWASGMLATAADQFLGSAPTSAQFLQGLWSIKNNDLGGLAPPLDLHRERRCHAVEVLFRDDSGERHLRRPQSRDLLMSVMDGAARRQRTGRN